MVCMCTSTIVHTHCDKYLHENFVPPHFSYGIKLTFPPLKKGLLYKTFVVLCVRRVTNL